MLSTLARSSEALLICKHGTTLCLGDIDIGSEKQASSCKSGNGEY
jgi:hypothetical protein